MNMQRASLKLLLASRTYFCRHQYTFRVGFVTAHQKQAFRHIFHSARSKFCCRLHMTSLLVKRRWKSDTTVNAVDHFVELCMPQTSDDVAQLTANVTVRNININISDLVRLFCSQMFQLYFT